MCALFEHINISVLLMVYVYFIAKLNGLKGIIYIISIQKVQNGHSGKSFASCIYMIRYMKGTIDFDSKFDQVITTVGDLKESSTFLVSLRENIMNAIEKQYEEVERLLHNKYKVSNYVTNGVHNHELPT